MNFNNDVTTVIGVDGKYIEQLRTVLPNWASYRPEILDGEVLLFYDSETMEMPSDLGEHFANLRIAKYDAPLRGFSSQREKMLAGHLFFATEVETPWFLKVDVDTYAINRDPWIDYRWFEGNPDWIASPWGYTKPANQMKVLDDWADGVPELAKYDRLNFPFRDGDRRVRHSRMCSWVMFGNVDYARWAFNLYDGLIPPVPSQDGYHYYVTERARRFRRTVKMRNFGWRNCSKLEHLKERVCETL